MACNVQLLCSTVEITEGTDTHTDASYKRTYQCVYANARTCAKTYADTRIYKQDIHTNVHTRTPTSMHIRTRMQKRICAYARKTRAHSNTCNMRIHAHTHIRTRQHPHNLVNRRSMWKRRRTRTGASVDSCTHARTSVRGAYLFTQACMSADVLSVRPVIYKHARMRPYMHPRIRRRMKMRIPIHAYLGAHTQVDAHTWLFYFAWTKLPDFSIIPRWLTGAFLGMRVTLAQLITHLMHYWYVLCPFSFQFTHQLRQGCGVWFTCMTRIKWLMQRLNL